VLTATVTQQHAGSYSVTVHPASAVVSQVGVPPKDGPSPIAPELNELAWTAGAFVVFAVLMRYVLYPRLRQGIDARYESIRLSHTSAESVRAAATAEVADYEAQLVALKAEAAEHIDEARRTLEVERNVRLADVNRELGAQRIAAIADNDAARQAVQGQIEGAIVDVSSRAVELAVGKRPDAALVGRAVAGVIASGGGR
jgi:F-type H+-transporting ATPase subunit b